MESQLRGEDVAKRFVRFIQDVIKYYTPNFGDYLDHPPSNWHHLLYGHDDRKAMYGYFCSALLGLEFTRYEDSRNPFQIRRTEDPDVAYAVLTLNYDQVLENCANLLQTKYGYQARFTQEEQGADEGPLDWSKQTYLAKLHGCVSTGNIIPPTWNKSLHEDGLATWRLAENLIREATQIRILGYSLSDSDTYIRYLLKAGILRSEFLKSISVWCRDPDGCVKNRYDSFVRLRPPRYSFKDIDIKEALLRHYNMYRNRGENSMVFSKSLESSHGELSR
jgi:hypothetical protein